MSGGDWKADPRDSAFEGGAAPPGARASTPLAPAAGGGTGTVAGPARTPGDGRRKTVPLVASLMLLLLFAVVIQGLLDVTHGPEQDLLTQLKKAERDGLTLAIDGAGPLVSQRVRFDRINVTAGEEAKRARAVATLDFTGKLSGTTTVSSLGLERVPFTFTDDDGWQPTQGLAPELSGIVQALERRRQALEKADAEALRGLFPEAPSGADSRGVDAVVAELAPIRERRYRAIAWYIRSEREEVVVAEEYRLQGTLPDRPVDVKGHSSLRLRKGPAGYSFSGTLR